MKKIICIIAAIILLSTAYLLGHQEGKRHAIEDSVIWTVACRKDPGYEIRNLSELCNKLRW